MISFTYHQIRAVLNNYATFISLAASYLSPAADMSYLTQCDPRKYNLLHCLQFFSYFLFLFPSLRTSFIFSRRTLTYFRTTPEKCFSFPFVSRAPLFVSLYTQLHPPDAPFNLQPLRSQESGRFLRTLYVRVDRFPFIL